MKSVSDELRERAAREIAALTPGERVQLALSLGEEGLRSFAAAEGLEHEVAFRRLRRQRQQGRRACACLALPGE